MQIRQRELWRLASALRRGRRGGGGRLLSLLALVVIAAAGYYQSRLPGTRETVQGVLDGDSLVIQREGRRQEVRLYAIDAPEKGQPFGAEARAWTARMVEGRPVTLKVHEQDRYGRLVSEVILEDGQSLNHALVEAGLAWWYRDHAEGDRQLARLEREAREAGRGLWADADPQPPWVYRRELREDD